MNQLNASKPCSSREHIDSIDKPGYCVWCDTPLKCKVCGVSKGHASSCPISAAQRRTLQDEMRATGELPHGIPAGENDPGWPEGTPEHIQRGDFIGPPDARQVAAVQATRPRQPGCTACGAVFGSNINCVACRAGARLVGGGQPHEGPELLQTGHALLLVFDAIRAGATLVLTGPQSLVSPEDPKFGASLEDRSGEISANAYGNELTDTLVALATDWQKETQLAEHQAAHDKGQA
jgi:hypothetical protein